MSANERRCNECARALPVDAVDADDADDATTIAGPPETSCALRPRQERERRRQFKCLQQPEQRHLVVEGETRGGRAGGEQWGEKGGFIGGVVKPTFIERVALLSLSLSHAPVTPRGSSLLHTEPFFSGK